MDEVERSDEAKNLMIILKKYEDQIDVGDYQDDGEREVTILKYEADIKYFPPCIMHILAAYHPKIGRARWKALFVSFLGQVGWPEEKAKKLFNKVSEQLGGPSSNIFKSWFRKMICFSCKKIQKKGSGFPHGEMGETGICHHDDICKEIANPLEYVERKRKDDLTLFSFEYNGKKHQIKFKQNEEKLLCYIITDDKKGLENETVLDFFRRENKRKEFFKGIYLSLDVVDKTEKDEIIKIFTPILLQLQETNIFSTDPIKEKEQQPKQYRKGKHKKTQRLGQYKEEDVIQEVYTDNTTIVVHTDTGVFLDKMIGVDKNGNEKWAPQKVFHGHIKPMEKLVIDGEFTVFLYQGDQERIADMPGIIRDIKKGGGVLNKNKIDDCINAIFLDLPTRTGHATAGVYEEGDRLELCLDAMPINDAQRRIKAQCEPSIKQEITKESLKAYFDTTNFWHDYEILPSMGTGAISPFVLMLRKHGKMFPNIWNFSPATHLGKSTVEKIFSMYLFSIFPLNGNSIDSEFRLSLAYDGICAYQVVEEADDVNWRKLEAILRDTPENYLCNVRGRADQTSAQFLSRAVLGINSNRFPVMGENTLVRIFKDEFDASVIDGRAGSDDRVEQLSETLNRLTPIGWRLAEIELEDVNHSLDILLERIANHEKEIRRLYTDFFDPRRAVAWSAIFEGLKIWESSAIKYGLEWRAPSYEDFVKNVIDHIETSTKDAREPPVMHFLRWFEMWQVQNITRIYFDSGQSEEQIRGINNIWAQDKELPNKPEYRGDIITSAITHEYQQTKNSKIDKVADIAKAINVITGIPVKELVGSWKIGGRSRYGVFLPYKIWKDDAPAPQKEENNKDPPDLEIQQVDIEKIERYIQQQGGKTGRVSETRFLAFLNCALARTDSERYLKVLLERGIVTRYSVDNEGIGFTGGK